MHSGLPLAINPIFSDPRSGGKCILPAVQERGVRSLGKSIYFSQGFAAPGHLHSCKKEHSPTVVCAEVFRDSMCTMSYTTPQHSPNAKYFSIFV
jgi:hypothetical protein